VDAAARPVTVVRVRPGDSLWLVARQVLPEGASDAAVDRTWRRIAACNADRLGPDPDLIFPGTLLRVPQRGRALGKDDR
jgi:nucleoid-associated protein YgaU